MIHLPAFFLLVLLISSASQSATIDSDLDEIEDSFDNCAQVYNPSQTDTDSDGLGNACDADDDGDGIVDLDDLWPLSPEYTRDSDGDGLADEYELLIGTDPQNYGDAAGDHDADGLQNVYEFLRTLSSHTDGDRDTLPDEWELRSGRNNNTPDYQLVAGDDHVCVLGDNKVQCWGSTSHGRVDVPSLRNPESISAGTVETCVIDSGELVCWGEPGGNPSPYKSKPVLTSPTHVSVGDGYTCVVDDGQVKCWGWNYNGQADPPELINPRKVAAGSGGSCALDDTGLVCWGKGWESTEYKGDYPKSLVVNRWFGEVCVLDTNSVLQCIHTGAVNPDNTERDVINFASGESGTWVIRGEEALPLDITSMTSPSLSNPVQIAVGASFICALTDLGVECWSGRENLEALDVPDNLSIDPDGDGYTNQKGLDKFSLDPTEWFDTDFDAVGNNTDDDDDNDGVVDSDDDFPLNASEYIDSDSDGVGDNADIFPNNPAETKDADSDGVGDNQDNCPITSNTDQLNTDGDEQGNACDLDDDNDGLYDIYDDFPLDASEQVDTDGDGLGDNFEMANGLDRKSPDSDSDGVNDGLEIEQGSDPLDPTSLDSDGDGLLNAEDTDDDNDGYTDQHELEMGADPLNPDDMPRSGGLSPALLRVISQEVIKNDGGG